MFSRKLAKLCNFKNNICGITHHRISSGIVNTRTLLWLSAETTASLPLIFLRKKKQAEDITQQDRKKDAKSAEAKRGKRKSFKPDARWRHSAESGCARTTNGTPHCVKIECSTHLEDGRSRYSIRGTSTISQFHSVKTGGADLPSSEG